MSDMHKAQEYDGARFPVLVERVGGQVWNSAVREGCDRRSRGESDLVKLVTLVSDVKKRA